MNSCDCGASKALRIAPGKTGHSSWCSSMSTEVPKFYDRIERITLATPPGSFPMPGGRALLYPSSAPTNNLPSSTPPPPSSGQQAPFPSTAVHFGRWEVEAGTIFADTAFIVATGPLKEEFVIQLNKNTNKALVSVFLVRPNLSSPGISPPALVGNFLNIPNWTNIYYVYTLIDSHMSTYFTLSTRDQSDLSNTIQHIWQRMGW